ncbi:MAG: SCO family protein, partial [Chloroflexales bacterium]|nr:SCO family protein [Chloroflexales bacterium]
MFHKQQIWRRLDRRWIIAMLALIGIISLSACSSAAAPAAIVDESLEQQGTPIEPPRQLTDFSLPGSTGETLSLSDLRGKMVLVYFGYTFCPDFCPMTLADFARIKQELGAQADQVVFMMISVDAERDTPEVLARYMSAFDEDFIGLTGDAG